MKNKKLYVCMSIFVFFGFFVFFLLFGRECFGYAVYIGSAHIGTIRASSQAHILSDILSAESGAAVPNMTVYPCLLRHGGYTPPEDLLQAGRLALGIETEIITETVRIPFPSLTVQSDELYEGETAVTVNGQAGAYRLQKRIVRIHGETTQSETVSASVITQPVAEVTAVGTKPRPNDIGSGVFQFPLAYIQVSSPFGTRWGKNHTGVDLAADSGENILAADNGIVTYSGECGGYGNLIIIDHQNGYETYYAHCLCLYARVGDTVAQGDCIAAVGSTGNSTGPHLHFEIRKNGTPEDPIPYLTSNT